MAGDSMTSLVVELPSDTEIRMTRAFRAPKQLVFEALTDAKHIPHWWGPRSLRMTVCEVDLRVGGHWRFVQKDPDGSEYAFHGEYREIAPPDRLSYTFEFEGMPGEVAIERIQLLERDGVTTLVNTTSYPSKEARDGVIESGMESGASESMERMGELLAALVKV